MSQYMVPVAVTVSFWKRWISVMVILPFSHLPSMALPEDAPKSKASTCFMVVSSRARRDADALVCFFYCTMTRARLSMGARVVRCAYFVGIL